MIPPSKKYVEKWREGLKKEWKWQDDPGSPLVSRNANPGKVKIDDLEDRAVKWPNSERWFHHEPDLSRLMEDLTLGLRCACSIT